MRRSISLLACLILGVVVYAFPARADDTSSDNGTASENGRLNILEENDYFASHDDRHYTQGAKVSYLSGPIALNDFWDQPFDALNDISPAFSGSERKRKYEWTIVGQSLFTPSNLTTTTPIHNDRPYAGWLYTGVDLLQDTNHGSYHTLEDFELLAGVVGPAALGETTQNTFHQFISENGASGWGNQLHNEPGLLLAYDHKWRFEQPLIGNFGIDALPEAGATAGNVLTYGDVGGMVRIGQNLGADYGPNRIRPSLSGTAWFDPDQMQGPLGWYVFLGTQGRLVGRNIFLDGNSFRPSLSVDKKLLDADIMGGASLFWSSALRVDFTVTERTKEFYGQQGTPDRFGGINLVIGF